ncbi:MAG: LysR family transcriptional regulator [Siculibacillus sp.]|nr:LysR family transcriptional regulator [Siculibacillus sp.]
MSETVAHLHPTATVEPGEGHLARARLRLRLVLGAGHKLGPGKIDLLEAVASTGSITAAGRRMGMSYRRAWLLIDEANRIFTEPLVTTASGGAGGGGAHLTDLGFEVVAAFRRIEARTRAAIADEFATLEPRFADLDAPLPER